MTSRIQSQRFSVTATKPPDLSSPPGELWLNFPDLRLGMIDPAQASVDLLAVRLHAATATYAAGDHVIYAGELQRAKTPLAPKAYLATDWDLIQSQSATDVRYLRLAGGTMTGALTLSADPTINLHAASKQYVDTIAGAALAAANAAVPKAGGTMTGPLILSDNPTVPLGAATKFYVDLFLPLAGGTVTGSLGVNGNITAGTIHVVSAFYPNAVNGYEWVFSADANGSKYQTYRGGWYDVWNGTNGQRDWVGAAGSLMNLNGSGVLSVMSAVNAGAFNTGGGGTFGAVAVGGTLTANYVSANAIVSNGNINAAGTYGGSTMNLTGRVQGSDVWSNSNVIIGNTSDFFIGPGGTGRCLFWSIGGGYFLQWSSATGQLDYMTGPNAFWIMRRSDALCYNGLGPVGGNGAYWNYSGIERKRDVEDCTHGVAAVRALRPVSFTRVPPPDIQLPDGTLSKHEFKREIGFIAQEVVSVIPEAVAAFGEDGALALDITPIVASLVNALKELDTRVSALEGIIR